MLQALSLSLWCPIHLLIYGFSFVRPSLLGHNTEWCCPSVCLSVRPIWAHGARTEALADFRFGGIISPRACNWYPQKVKVIRERGIFASMTPCYYWKEVALASINSEWSCEKIYEQTGGVYRYIRSPLRSLVNRFSSKSVGLCRPTLRILCKYLYVVRPVSNGNVPLKTCMTRSGEKPDPKNISGPILNISYEFLNIFLGLA